MLSGNLKPLRPLSSKINNKRTHFQCNTIISHFQGCLSDCSWIKSELAQSSCCCVICLFARCSTMLAVQSGYTRECPEATQCLSLWRQAQSCIAFCSWVHLSLAEHSGEKEREEILVHSLFSAIMNALSGRIHQQSLWGEKMSGKVMVCWLLTHVAQPRKVIEVQKMSCCCISSICIAVSQDK